MTTLTPVPTTAVPALGWTAHDTVALIDRCLRRSLRQLDTVLLSVILPVMLLLMFVYVFGGAIETGGDYVNWVVPGIILLTAGYGAANTAVDVASDMTGGIIDRFRSLPIRPTGVVTGHVVASMARNAVSTALVFGIAALIGFDAVASPLDWLAAIGLIALYVLALTWVAVAIGIVASGPEAASGFTFAVLFLPYVSSAFVPPETMPSALEAIAQFNPVTPITDTLRGLLLGTPVGDVVVPALLWCVGIFLVGRIAAGLLFRRRD
ncbi:ABC transporter permease [Cellulomonas sp. Leaf395]|uniref:ABC transporter permease n=1 Tax=Cellulomonas sp. Leaf395 TaxID=1736362 RepID=UPI000701F0E8|nr:ABC transporter permease [Cellulomonas sp. Leaf395]KQT01951.1 multidrug ABC transporter permease [Cellulomonas sp. Leaf395]